LDHKELQRICEAILFAAGEPVPAQRLALVTACDPEELHEAMRELMDQYAFERRGIRIVRLEDSYQMCSQSDLAPWVTKALETRKPPKLSASQLETLTVIAYYQPTTKAFVESLRGVDSSYTVAALLTKKLICEDGRLNAPGRPILYRTTPDFLRTFGLESLEDLPEIDKVDFSAPPAPEAPAGDAGTPPLIEPGRSGAQQFAVGNGQQATGNRGGETRPNNAVGDGFPVPRPTDGETPPREEVTG
jgi:segregation and condensation protein B